MLSVWQCNCKEEVCRRNGEAEASTATDHGVIGYQHGAIYKELELTAGL